MSKTAAPILKWAGGKRRLLEALRPLLPQQIEPYAEPFVGGGALLFNLRPMTAYVNDVNPDLIELYRTIRDHAEGVIAQLSRHKNDEDYFYEIRDWDRDKAAYAARSPVERAARTLFLNKTCFNGLHRVNSAGLFNVPFGFYKSPELVNAPALLEVSAYFNQASIVFTCGDYVDAVRELPRGAFVYFDPPYDPVSRTANFTAYSKGGFGRDEQIRLRELCDVLDRRGVRFMLSNSATDFIRAQYANYRIDTIQAARAIAADPGKRGPVDEVVVRNYG